MKDYYEVEAKHLRELLALKDMQVKICFEFVLEHMGSKGASELNEILDGTQK